MPDTRAIYTKSAGANMEDCNPKRNTSGTKRKTFFQKTQPAMEGKKATRQSNVGIRPFKARKRSRRKRKLAPKIATVEWLFFLPVLQGGLEAPKSEILSLNSGMATLLFTSGFFFFHRGPLKLPRTKQCRRGAREAEKAVRNVYHVWGRSAWHVVFWTARRAPAPIQMLNKSH